MSNPANSTDVLNSLDTYQDYIGINLDDEYGYKLLNTTEKKAIGQKFIDFPCDTTQKTKDQFNDNVMLTLLNNKDWETMEDVINNNYDLLQVKFNEKCKMLAIIMKNNTIFINLFIILYPLKIFLTKSKQSPALLQLIFQQLFFLLFL